MERLEEKYSAQQLLWRKFVQEIKASDEPRDVHQSDPVFQDHNLDAFQTILNKLK